MSSFKRNAALWVLRQAARRLAEETAKRQQSGAGAGSTYPAAGERQTTSGTGSAHRPAGERPGWATAAGPRVQAIGPRVEDLVRRAWPLLDTPANRDRVHRFVERMRTVPDQRR